MSEGIFGYQFAMAIFRFYTIQVHFVSKHVLRRILLIHKKYSWRQNWLYYFQVLFVQGERNLVKIARLASHVFSLGLGSC